MKEVNIIIKDGGKIEVDAVGFKGKGCLEATSFIDKLFGVLSRKKKGDMYKKEVVKNVRH